MKTRFASIALALAFATAAATVACSSSSSPSPTSPNDGGTGADTSTGGQDANPGTDSSTGEDAGVDSYVPPFDGGTTYMRLVNVSPDSPALDFCYAPNDNSDFKGPVLGSAGVVYGASSTFIAFPGGMSYGVRAVVAGGDCSIPLGSVDTPLTTLDDGQYTTLAAIGDTTTAGSDIGIGLHAYEDDRAPATSGDVGVRFINASPSITPADFGLGSLAGSSFSALYTNVGSGDATLHSTADAGASDGNQYVTIAPLANATISAHKSLSTTDEVTATSVNVAAGKVFTYYLAGAKTGDAAHPERILACDDSAADATKACSFVSP